MLFVTFSIVLFLTFGKEVANFIYIVDLRVKLDTLTLINI